METKQEQEKAIAFFKKHNPDRKYDIGLCQKCFNKTIHEKKDDNSSWECTSSSCKENIKEKEAERYFRNEKARIKRISNC